MMDIFDAHFHLIPPGYPLVENNGFLPDYFSLPDYQMKLKQMELEAIGGAIVAGSFQGFDQSFLTDALDKLPTSFVGVAQVPFDLSDQELDELDRHRIRAIRYNLFRGTQHLDLDKMIHFSHQVYQRYGWHTEIYLDGRQMEELLPFLLALPKIVIDHLAMAPITEDSLTKLIANQTSFKATGFGRIELDPIPLMEKIVSLDPSALIFGTDLPGTRARRIFQKNDLTLITDNFSKELAHKILVTNAQALYLKESN